jgi:hypothetical protein
MSAITTFIAAADGILSNVDPEEVELVGVHVYVADRCTAEWASVLPYTGRDLDAGQCSASYTQSANAADSEDVDSCKSCLTEVARFLAKIAPSESVYTAYWGALIAQATTALNHVSSFLKFSALSNFR